MVRVGHEDPDRPVFQEAMTAGSFTATCTEENVMLRTPTNANTLPAALGARK
jgi:hypothetical protein